MNICHNRKKKHKAVFYNEKTMPGVCFNIFKINFELSDIYKFLNEIECSKYKKTKHCCEIECLNQMKNNLVVQFKL